MSQPRFLRQGSAAQGKPVLVHFLGASGSGKTTLIVKLLRVLTRRGLRVGAIKHTHHAFEMDRPGKDSYRFTAAGAAVVAIASARKAAILWNKGDIPEASQLAGSMRGVDMVLVEGFRKTSQWQFHVEGGKRPKRLGRPLGHGRGYLGTIGREGNFHISDVKAIADFLVKKFALANIESRDTTVLVVSPSPQTAKRTPAPTRAER